ncbi:general substrate transporter [Corynascus novoguineensis]|uniref:General substrate transporter n=1 Tax=Corynascus novoguineensis TaxID=1126955 RepID=A0AAN7CP69_9PEZI|nr:general substrate transporter [Corynascus novoguineensis]
MISKPEAKLEPGDTPALSNAAEQTISFAACLLGTVASAGGFMLGYASGQISGFFPMNDFAQRFGEEQADGTFLFSAVRQGTIVGFLDIGCLLGALLAGKLADAAGRRWAISLMAFFGCVGTAIEISASRGRWVQFALGRAVTGVSVGSLAVVVPMYQAESSPAAVRGLVVSLYQLLVTLGIWAAEMVNWATEARADSGCWRIPNGLGVIWALALGVGILFFPESPRHAFRKGHAEEARHTIARLAGLDPNSPGVEREMAAIKAKLDEERRAAETRWHDMFTGDRMLYRVALGVVLEACMQLTGVNFFFYYGTTVFKSTGISNSYVTQLVFGSVNVVCTVAGLYLIHRAPRRAALIGGAACMMACFFVYAFVGHYSLDHEDPMRTPAAGAVLIAVSCLATAAFASTWGLLVWSVVAEMYPSQYRAKCMALATAANLLWNFLISFFTRFITDAIDYFYGFVFACSCAVAVLVVFFFLIEPKGRTLEEIDTMYILRVPPNKSGKWRAEDVRH